jgi:hypothetical protein
MTDRRWKSVLIALTLSGCAFGPGCTSENKLPAAVQPGVYMFVLNHNGTEVSSNAVREAVNRPLSGDFGLPSKFLFLDPHGATIALVAMPSLVIDTPQARQLKLGPAAGKLKSYVLSGGSGTGQFINPKEIRAAADAIRLEESTNRAVFLIGPVSTNSSGESATSQPRIPAYWLESGTQNADARRLALTALHEAGFDVLAHQTDLTLFWESVLSKTARSAVKPGSGPALLAKNSASSRPAAGSVSMPQPQVPRESSRPPEPPPVRSTPSGVAASAPPASALPSPGTTKPVTRSPIDRVAITPVVSPTPAVELTAPRPAPPRPASESELRAYLDGFNVDGKHIMDTLPPCFVGIKYTHSSAADPIALALSQPEKREFNFPGSGAGTTRLVSKVAREEYVEALECYGFDDTDPASADRLLITLMRRADPREQEAKLVELIVRRGAQIVTRPVSVPSGAGMVLPLRQFLN